MNKNQFFYKRKVEKPVQVQGTEVQYDEVLDSFNVNKAIRSMTIGNEVIIILDDFNERVTQQPDINPKNGQVKGTKNVRETVQSEIHLSKFDGERFFKLTSIE